jgi:hypothetical protein
LICQCRQIALYPGYPMQATAHSIRTPGLGTRESFRPHR